MSRGKVLVVDDQRAMRELLVQELEDAGYVAQSAPSAKAALEQLGGDHPDVVVTDLRMPGGSGVELCRELVGLYPEVPVIVMTAFGSMEAAVEAIRAGAYDFITKPFDFPVLQVALDRALTHQRMRAELRKLRSDAGTADFEGMHGVSPVMRKLYELVERLAPTDAPVLLQGESGSGKELVARALHKRSLRADGPFVALNCAAIPEALFENELFGHVRGAFTGAERDRAGLLRQAHGGTLFLDEVGEMPASVQPKLLRVLQEGRVRPVGADIESRIDVRLVVATNRDLAGDVASGKFRADLYYRLAVITIHLPPLRERGDDILLLAEHFLDQLADDAGKPRPEIGDDAAARLLSHAWPGNVRELRNCMERAVALTRHTDVQVEDLPERVSKYRRSHMVIASDDPTELVPLEEVERRYILRVVETVAGNKTMAAKILGLDRKTLYRKLERYKQE